jgi:hypothetical protein
MTSRPGPASGLIACNPAFACCTSTTLMASCPRVCCWFGSRRRLVRREDSFSSACCFDLRLHSYSTVPDLNWRAELRFLCHRQGESILICGCSSSLSVFGSIVGPVWDMDMDITFNSTSIRIGRVIRTSASRGRAAVEAVGIDSVSGCTSNWSLDVLCVGRVPPFVLHSERATPAEKWYPICNSRCVTEFSMSCVHFSHDFCRHFR